jgi:hypothetical protein
MHPHIGVSVELLHEMCDSHHASWTCQELVFVKSEELCYDKRVYSTPSGIQAKGIQKEVSP